MSLYSDSNCLVLLSALFSDCSWDVRPVRSNEDTDFSNLAVWSGKEWLESPILLINLPMIKF